MHNIFFNRYFDKNRLKSLVLWSLHNKGEKETIELVEKLKTLGFSSATQAGLSLGIDDLKIPPNKADIISAAELQIRYSLKEYERGHFTLVEKSQQMVDIWHKTSEILKQSVIQNFRRTDVLNPVYMMAFSGARGNISQVRQLVGMRGLMADPQGKILDFPIQSNFREGLTVTEYVISCFGARKGLVDTALRTANSGYLTRRLVDVAQHIIVRQLDCGSSHGIYLTDMRDGQKILLPLQTRLIGRVIAETIPSVAVKNQDISPELATKLATLKKSILVRSPLTCESKRSICQLCYGWSLAHGTLVSLGEAVGILAAQSIGEPGTQLTMRTFHTGGVFSGDVMDEIRSPFDGIVHFSSSCEGKLIRTLHGKIAFLTKTEGDFIIKSSSNESTIKFHIPQSTILYIRESEKVFQKQLLAEFSSISLTQNKGILSTYNVQAENEGEVFFENVNLVIQKGKDGEKRHTAIKFGSMWVLAGKLYHSVFPSNVFLQKNDVIDTSSIIHQSAFVTPFTGFLANGLNKNKKTLVPSFTLSQELISLDVRNLHYKKFGYFFSTSQQIFNHSFLRSSLNHSQKTNNQFIFKSFPKKTSIKISGKLIYKNLYLNTADWNGTLFFIPQESYFFNYLKAPYRNQKVFLLKNALKQNKKSIFYIQNKQQDKKRIYSKQNGFTCIIKKNHTLNEVPTIEGIFPKQTSNKQLRNPYSFVKKFQKNNMWEKTLSHKNLTNFIEYNSKIKKIDYKIKDAQISSLIEPKQNDLYTVIKNQRYKIKIKSGWIYSSTKIKPLVQFHLSFITPGSYLFDDIMFDQNFVHIECLPYKRKSISASQKIFIKNKKFLLKKQADFYYFINHSKSVNLNHHKLISCNYNLKKKYCLIIQKSIEYHLINKKTCQKTIFQLSVSSNSYTKNYLRWYENKQKKTKLLFPIPNIQFSFSSTLPNITKTKTLKQPTNLIEISTSFSFSKTSPKYTTQIVFNYPNSLQIFKTQKIHILNFMLSEFQKSNSKTKKETKTLISKKLKVDDKKNVFVSSFLAPYSGEIIKTKNDRNGKKQTLILTEKDKLSFLRKEKSEALYLGQLLRYGDQISDSYGVSESGQIIEITSKKITIRKAKPILFSPKGIFHQTHGNFIEKNSPLITLFYEQLKTGDIVQGIPKIEELFEARQTKEGEELAQSMPLTLTSLFEIYKEQGSPQDAARKSIERVQRLLVDNVQKVYQSQGVTIADKHIEIIVRQMTSKVRITEGGRTGLLRGELIDLEWVEIVNGGIEAQNQTLQSRFVLEKAEYEPILLGITKASLETESFISAASFQETTRILGQAAIERKTDFLRGLKENVILGHLIPAGTGFSLSFDPQIKVSGKIMKLSWAKDKDLVKSVLKKQRI